MRRAGEAPWQLPGVGVTSGLCGSASGSRSFPLVGRCFLTACSGAAGTGRGFSHGGGARGRGENGMLSWAVLGWGAGLDQMGCTGGRGPLVSLDYTGGLGQLRFTGGGGGGGLG